MRTLKNSTGIKTKNTLTRKPVPHDYKLAELAEHAYELYQKTSSLGNAHPKFCGKRKMMTIKRKRMEKWRELLAQQKEAFSHEEKRIRIL